MSNKIIFCGKKREVLSESIGRDLVRDYEFLKLSSEFLIFFFAGLVWLFGALFVLGFSALWAAQTVPAQTVPAQTVPAQTVPDHFLIGL